MGFKHKFNSGIADSGDVALVQPSNWNDVHISDFASGALTFSASAGGNIIVDESNLIWDNTNKRLGVGTSAPQYNLHVVGSQIVDNITITGLISAGSFEVDTSLVSGETRVLIWDVDNNSLERVTVGPPDSGGSGYKILRIPN